MSIKRILSSVLCLFFVGCNSVSKHTIQDQEGNFKLDLPEQWTLCSDATVSELGKLNNGWTLAENNPERNRIIGCAQDQAQMVQVVVRWTKEWLPRIFVPPGGMSATGDNVESVPLPSTHDGAVTADNIDQMKIDEQEWFFGILTRVAEHDMASRDKNAKLVSSNHKSLPNGYLLEFVTQFPKAGFWFESTEIKYLPKHDKRVLSFSCVTPLKVKEKYQTDLALIQNNFNSWVEGKSPS